jgi:hypothetical protein
MIEPIAIEASGHGAVSKLITLHKNNIKSALGFVASALEKILSHRTLIYFKFKLQIYHQSIGCVDI